MAGAKGVDILISVEGATAGTYIDAGGQRGATLSESVETIEMTNKTSGGYKEFDYSFGEWKISADGVYVSSDAGYKALVAAMRGKKFAKVRWKEGAASTFEGLALIVSRDLEAPYDGEATYKIEFQGTGAPTLVV